MNRLLSTATTLTTLALLGGCVATTPAAGGASVRAIMASQAVPPQPRPEGGAAGTTAVAAYANYQGSYVTPASQSERGTFSGK